MDGLQLAVFEEYVLLARISFTIFISPSSCFYLYSFINICDDIIFKAYFSGRATLHLLIVIFNT